MGDEYLTLPQAQAWLAARGVKVSKNSLRKWVRVGRLPAVRPGLRAWYIHLDALASLLEKPPEEPEHRNALAMATC